MSASHPNHPRLPSEENVSPQSTLVNDDTRFNKNKSNFLINSNNSNTPTLSTSVPLKPNHMTVSSIRTPIITKSSGPSSKMPTLINTPTLSSSSSTAAHTSQLVQERDDLRLKLDAAEAEMARLRANYDAFKLERDSERQQENQVIQERDDLRLIFEAVEEENTQLRSNRDALNLELDSERQRINQLQQQLNQLKDIQADYTTLSEMYEELLDKFIKLCNQSEYDRGIIAEYDQLSNDAVEENQILRQWVNELGGDPDNDQATWNRLREYVRLFTTSVSDNNSPSN